MSLPGWETVSKWIFHPGVYEMIWYVLLCVVWYGFTIERRLKIIQRQLDATTAEEKRTPPARS